ncbi:hypothetical protein [uncultured Tateyamaria sp.]|uniref:hypothetical protein n=1 Tax=uncultured Tateyamaria sp. TaxID=455651 RepID=UPI00262012C7|nr:hypothetical protein [uncultured Tateyamaria sp.]
MSVWGSFFKSSAQLAKLFVRIDGITSQAEKLDERSVTHAKEIAELRGKLEGLQAISLIERHKQQDELIKELSRRVEDLEELLQFYKRDEEGSAIFTISGGELSGGVTVKIREIADAKPILGEMVQRLRLGNTDNEPEK